MAILKEHFVIFEAWIDGKLARTEVPVDAKALNSREGRKDAESLARLSFMQLSQNFHPNQRIKAVDIVSVITGEN